MRWTPKRTLPIVKPSLEHRYKQREIKTGRKPDDRQEREAAPHGAVSLLVLHNNEERLFAKIRSFRKGFLTGAADHLRIGDTGTARFGTTSRQKNGPACSGPQLGSSYPFRGLLGSFSRSRLRAGSCSARIAFQRVGTINALCGNELGSSLGSLFCSSRFVRIACTRYHRGSSNHNDKCINLFHGNKEIKMVIAANISNRSK